MKKRIFLLLTAALLLGGMRLSAAADFTQSKSTAAQPVTLPTELIAQFQTHTPGEPLGWVLYTDIVTYIDGYPLQSYNIGGYTYIVAEDLINFGFDVVWDGTARKLSVGNRVGGITSTFVPTKTTHIPGEPAMQYLYTDITTWLQGKKVTSYNIGGYTCIGMDDFAALYADTYVWDNGTRELRMTVSDTPIQSPVKDTDNKTDESGLKEYVFSSWDDPMLIQVLKQKILDTKINNRTQTATVDISSVKIPYNSESAQKLFDMVFSDMPEVFYANNITVYSVSPKYMSSLELRSDYTEEEYRRRLNAAVEVAKELTADLVDNTELTDAEKCLLVHDRLAVLCEYNLDVYYGKSTESADTMYDALVKHKAVCQGYSEAYLYMMNLLQIPCELCSSDSLNHIWNIVTIDGEQYHIDVTYDDPIMDMTGRVSHENFLRSTHALPEHDAYDYDRSPDSTVYDNAAWLSSDAEAQFVNGEIYFVDNITQWLCRLDGITAQNIWNVADRWNANGGYWQDNYTRLASDGNILYFSLNDEIYQYDVTTGSCYCIYELDEAGQIFGLTYGNGYLIFDCTDTPNYESGTKANALRSVWVG